MNSSLVCQEHPISLLSSTGCDAWLEDLMDVQEEMRKLEQEPGSGAIAEAYGVSGWQLSVAKHLQRHFGCLAPNFTYFRGTEKRDRLMTPTWFSLREGPAVEAGMPLAAERFHGLRSVFLAGASEEIASLGVDPAWSADRPSAFERQNRCSLTPDGEMSALSLTFLASRTRRGVEFTEAMLRPWMRYLGLLDGAGVPSMRLVRLFTHLARRRRGTTSPPMGDQAERILRDLTCFVEESGPHAAGGPRGVTEVVEFLLRFLDSERTRKKKYGFNILGHIALRLTEVPKRSPGVALPSEFFNYFESLPPGAVLDRSCTDRSCIVVPLLRSGTEEHLDAFFLGSHVGLSAEIAALNDTDVGRISAWSRYGRLIASLQVVSAPVMLRTLLSDELRRERYSVGVQVLAHHSGKLFQESGLVGLATEEAIDPDVVRGVARRLWPAWGIAEATRIMKTAGTGVPSDWLPANDPASLNIPPENKIIEQLYGLCRFYLSGWLIDWPGHWQVSLGDELLNVEQLRPSGGLPVLFPFLEDDKQAGTTAATVGLAELVRNIRHYLSQSRRQVKRALRSGKLSQPLLRIRCSYRPPAFEVNLLYPLMSTEAAHSASRTISTIQQFERQLLLIRGKAIAETHQVAIVDELPDGWVLGKAKWTYFMDELLLFARRKEGGAKT